jgi:hypothetical protein
MFDPASLAIIAAFAWMAKDAIFSEYNHDERSNDQRRHESRKQNRQNKTRFQKLIDED